MIGRSFCAALRGAGRPIKWRAEPGGLAADAAEWPLGLVGPSAAEETTDDAVEVDSGAATADATSSTLCGRNRVQRGDTDGALSATSASPAS